MGVLTMTDITENGKYYIPSIEEFHVGFEFEFYEGRSLWEKRVFSFEDRYKAEMLKYFIQRGDVRVKYLDEDDIIAEGWEKGEEDHTFHFNGYTLCAPQRSDKSTTIWTNKTITDKDEIIFYGTILNRSELHRIMKQVGIIEK